MDKYNYTCPCGKQHSEETVTTVLAIREGDNATFQAFCNIDCLRLWAEEHTRVSVGPV